MYFYLEIKVIDFKIASESRKLISSSLNKQAL